MARTRSSKAAPAKPTGSEVLKSAPKITLVSHAGEPPKVFLLPSKATPEARVVALSHPRSSQPARYLACPETGIYEFTKVAAPKTTPRSWLIEASNPDGKETGADGVEPKTDVTMGSELYVATAIDPLFLVLPALADAKRSRDFDEPKRLFLSSDDHFDKLPRENSHLSEILRWNKTRKLMETRMGAVCDTINAGDESMFRLNEKKLTDVILEKAKRMSGNGLPPSTEEKFVKKVLEAPLMLKKVNVGENQAINGVLGSEVSTPNTDSTTSQFSAFATETESSVSQPSTAMSSFTEEPASEESIVSAMEASAEVIKLQRLRVAFDFICSRYVTPILADQLQKSLASEDGGSVDFSPLNDYLTELRKLRSEAMATRSGDYSSKRARDEEADEVQAEKKRKLDEEKKKKASESHGVRQLKKVNTTGMKKLSDFFKKK